MSSDQLTCFLLYIWDEGVIISHHKDLYKPISILERHKSLVCCSLDQGIPPNSGEWIREFSPKMPETFQESNM